MRWIADTTTKQNITRRTRYVFAWIPTRVGSWFVWLESYKIQECLALDGFWEETSRNLDDRDPEHA